MLCCNWKCSRRWLLNSSSLPDPSIITNTNLQNKVVRRLQLTHSSYSPPAINFSGKSIGHMDSVPKNEEPMFEFLNKKPYLAPSWASRLNPIPSHVFSLGHFPTPIHKWNLPNLPKNTEVYIKRDDLSGMQLSGNKVRKLEFLLADAVAQGADCIITIGGIQSNHCRATAVAAKYLNLDCYLILRTSKVLVEKDPGLTGNLLVERLVGAHIDLVSKEEYAKVGSVALTSVLKDKLLNEGRKPYVIPVGGSNSLGTWGYIEAIREIKEQCQKGNGEVGFDDIVVACGSGGTIAGLSVGSFLSDLGFKVHAYCVCDDPDYFYDFAQGLLDGLQAGVSSRDIVRIQNAKGLGYAMNTIEELKFVRDIAEATGIVLDPVYSGKAAYGMMRDMSKDLKKWEGRKVLFIHTGGLLGLFDKAGEMASLVRNWRRMDIHESVPQKEGTALAMEDMPMHERIVKGKIEIRAADAAKDRGRPAPNPVEVPAPSPSHSKRTRPATNGETSGSSVAPQTYELFSVPLLEHPSAINMFESFYSKAFKPVNICYQQMERIAFREQTNQESQARVCLLEREKDQLRVSNLSLKKERDRNLEQARYWEERYRALEQQQRSIATQAVRDFCRSKASRSWVEERATDYFIVGFTRCQAQFEESGLLLSDVELGFIDMNRAMPNEFHMPAVNFDDDGEGN